MSRRSALVVALILNLILSGLAFTAVPAVSAATITVCAVGCDHTTIQAAVTAAAAGDTITVGAGTYQEQVIVDKNLTITGAGAATTTILSPTVPVANGPGGEEVIVLVRNAAVVTMSGFTIAGPANTCTLNGFLGVFVIEDADLTLSDSIIRDIRPTGPPSGFNFGCGIGVGVRIGANYLMPAGVGTATLTNLLIVDYEKSGLIVDAPGSDATMTGSTITGVGSNTAIAQNGAEIRRGATATLTGNSISENICDRVGAVFPNPPNPDDAACGPGQITATNPQAQATGLLILDAGLVSLVNNTIGHNDIGIVAISFYVLMANNVGITSNAILNNRWNGLVLADGTYDVSSNDITGTSNVGVQIADFDVFGTNTTAMLANNRIANAARGVQIDDFDTGNAFMVTVTGDENSLADNGIGVDNGTGTPANFPNSWWGSAAGPQAPGNPGGDGVPIVGNVPFTPFLTDGTDFSTARGFQPGTISAGLSTATLTFANQTVGTTSASLPVTLTNTGSEPLNISAITVSGDFAQTNNCPPALAAAANCAINVTFTPVVTGARNGTLMIFDNAGNSPQLVTLSGTGIDPAVTFDVVASVTGSGTITPSGTTNYVAGTLANYTATPGAGQVFLGWTLDGVYVGYASPLTFTVNSDRTLVARFVARPTFTDVPAGDPDYQAITFLAALGVINPAGVNGSGQFQPNRDVVRAEMASFIARIFGWQKEFHANPFPDKCDPQGQNCIDDELWNNVAALADYGVVGGYTDPATCQSAGTTAPCYLPRDPVKRVQVLSIIARAFIKAPDLRPTGFWDRLAADLSQYTNVPDTGTQRSDLTTYRTNAGPIPGQTSNATFPDPEGNGSRRFVIQALYQAFNAVYGTDNVP